MKRILTITMVLGLAFVVASTTEGRGRGGGGGGGFRGGAPMGGSAPRAVSPYSGSARAVTSGTQVTGPRGGTGQAGTKSGSITTKGGSTIGYKGAGAGGTTAGGVSGGKYVGGVQVTGPGGQTASKVGTGGAIAGPGGKAVGGRTSISGTTGPAGTGGAINRSGTAIGPGGAVHGKGTIATGPGGTVAGRSGVAVGPYGAVGGRAVATTGGTFYRSSAAIRGQGIHVRSGITHYPVYRRGYWATYPGAWYGAGWVAATAWRAATWGACASYCGCSEEPAYYDYGETVVYQEGDVYIGGEKAATGQEYAQQATALADSGRAAKVAKDDEFLPLGVFAMVQGDEKVSNHIFQLAVDKKGVIRGNYYDAVTDSSSPIFGSVDQKTQRAAWTVGERKAPVYEAGIANLTKDETTMILHYSKDRSQQFSLIRVEEPKEDEKK